MHDAATLAFYDREAAGYAARDYQEARSVPLDRFLDALTPGATILELGCGGGRNAEQMIGRGFDVTATDGSPGLVAAAERRLGRPVGLMLFEDLDAVEAYDAVWAAASLLHAPAEALPAILGKVRRALKPGGRFLASYKAGDRPDRDALGRYYNFPTEAGLRAAYGQAGPWASLIIEHAKGSGYDRVPRDWLICQVIKP